ncbi:hypothetical protein [Nocardioides sp.]|uniref:hypothetical protein n=1 Tax=Nocardioides sp. TaxID=35761 RepID=UPI002639EFC1|nr:hypothetical protein [Nocardioides sp.]
MISPHPRRPARRSTRLMTLVGTGALLASGLTGTGLAADPAGAAPAPSGPGTLVYVKGYDVFVARPDGSGERRITTGGTAAAPWHAPSGADNGTIAAVRGPRVYRFDQWGNLLNSFDPPNLTDSAGQPLGGGIDDAVISPDGALIAYTYRRYSCPPGLACKMRWSTAVSAAGTLTDPSRFGTALYGNPSWVTSTRLALNGTDFDAVQVFDLALRTRHWFHDGNTSSEYLQLTAPVVSRDASTLALIRGEGDQSHIATYRIGGNIRSGPVPAPPDPACATTRADGFASPTFSPDSRALAWAEPDGIWLTTAALDCQTQPVLAVRGAREPYWSGAALGAGTRFAVVRSPRLSGRAAVGRILRADPGAWAPRPARVAFQWLRNGRPIRGVHGSAYRLRKRDRGTRIALRITLSRPGTATKSWLGSGVRVRR